HLAAKLQIPRSAGDDNPCTLLLRRWLSVAQRVIQCLVTRHVLFYYAPAVVKAAESDSRPVVHSAVVKRGAHLIDRYPTPGKLDVSEVARLADSGNAQQFAARDLDRDGAVVAAIVGKGIRNQGPYRLYSERCEQHVPARWRLDSGGTLLLGADNPSVALQDHEVGRTEILVGNDAGP